jgi:hypothetical protein
LLGHADIACGAEPGWLIEPLWLGHVCGSPAYSPTAFTLIEPGVAGSPSPSRSALEVAVDPAILATLPSLAPGQQQLVEFAGQFDHPAATTCHAVDPTASSPTAKPAAELVLLKCRSQFVVTALHLR